ncbi:YqaE/Pmp3 family membrane protein [Pontibacter sp. MBLB2868]|uniref:YqaE/Pmp3 family membrane protein n=1 Tax=Pontibacter sp. MBLB2868 TaxID=3451555 RepID=UPI003F74BBB9
MKIRNLLNLLVVLLVGQLMFACSSAKYYEFAAHKPEAFNKAKEKPAVTDQEKAETTLSQIALEAATAKDQENASAPILEASAAKPAPAVLPKPVVKEEVATANTATLTEAEALAMAKENIASLTKSEKRELKKDLKEAVRQDRGRSGTSIIELVLAVLLPPLAVFLHDGIGTSFWINIILTLLFIIPGIIHALLVVTDSI